MSVLLHGMIGLILKRIDSRNVFVIITIRKLTESLDTWLDKKNFQTRCWFIQVSRKVVLTHSFFITSCWKMNWLLTIMKNFVYINIEITYCTATFFIRKRIFSRVHENIIIYVSILNSQLIEKTCSPIIVWESLSLITLSHYASFVLVFLSML